MELFKGLNDNFKGEGSIYFVHMNEADEDTGIQNNLIFTTDFPDECKEGFRHGNFVLANDKVIFYNDSRIWWVPTLMDVN